MNADWRALSLAALLVSLFALPVRAERDLSIDAISINGQYGGEIRVRAGELISGRVNVYLRSSSLLRAHTAVWLPSWENYPSAMRVFYESIGGSENLVVPIDLYAPSSPGIYYIGFCFDRKHASEMYSEITMRSFDQMYSNGRAIRIVVGGYGNTSNPFAQGLSAPMANAGLLEVNSGSRTGTAGSSGSEAIWRIVTNSLSGSNDDAVRIRMSGNYPNVDLDLEVIDQYGRRRGLSEREGSMGEEAVVRVRPGEVLFAKVYGFKRQQDAPYTIAADRVSLFASRIDPSFGRATSVSNQTSRRDRAGYHQTNAQWYVFTLPSDGSFDVEVSGADSARNLDLWIYDDLGNIRSSSRIAGSSFERAAVEFAEAGTYYAKVGGPTVFDESEFDVRFRINSSSSSSYSPGNSDPAVRFGDGDKGVELDFGGIKIRF